MVVRFFDCALIILSFPVKTILQEYATKVLFLAFCRILQESCRILARSCKMQEKGPFLHSYSCKKIGLDSLPFVSFTFSTVLKHGLLKLLIYKDKMVIDLNLYEPSNESYSLFSNDIQKCIKSL